METTTYTHFTKAQSQPAHNQKIAGMQWDRFSAMVCTNDNQSHQNTRGNHLHKCPRRLKKSLLRVISKSHNDMQTIHQEGYEDKHVVV
jgi:hypothetical protein